MKLPILLTRPHNAVRPVSRRLELKLVLTPCCIVRLLLATLALLSAGSALAATGTWKSTAVDGLWSNTANWSASPVPGSGDTARFQSNSVYTTIDLGAGVAVKSITLTTTNCAAYTIGSGGVNAQTLTLEDGGLVQGNSALMNGQLFNAKILIGSTAGASTIQFNPIFSNNIPAVNRTMTLAGDISGSAAGGAKTLNLAPSSTGPALLVVSGVISDGGAAPLSVAKNNGGTLTLSGANTYTGNTTMSGGGAGTLALNNVNALQSSTLDTGVSGAQKVTFVLAGANTYNLGGLQGADDLVIGTNSINVGGNGASTTYAGAISGAGSLIKSGTGTLTLSGTNSYTGSTTISNGTLALSGIGALASTFISNYATFDVSGGSGYQLTSGQTLLGTGSVTGPLTVNAGATLTVGGSSGTDGLGTMAVAGDLTLNGTAVLRLNKGGTSDQISVSGALSVNGTLNLNSVGAALVNGDQIQVVSAGSGISGTPAITGYPGAGLEWDASTLTTDGKIRVVASSNPPVFATALADQTVECGSNVTFYALATGTAPLFYTWRVNGATVASGLDLTTYATNNVHAGGSTYTVSVQVTNLISSANSSCTLTVQDTANPVLTLIGTNQLWLLVGQAFIDPGATAMDTCAGVITPTVSGAVNTNVAGDYILTYSANDGSNVVTTNRTVHVLALQSDIWTNTAGGFWSDTLSWSNNVVASGFNVTADFSQIDITADTTVTLDSAQTIGGLVFGDTDTASSANWILSNNGTAGNTLTLAGQTPTVNVNALGTASKVTIAAVVAGSAGLNKAGAGTLALTAANTYTGGTTISNGTVSINADSGLGTAPGSATPGSLVLDGGTLSVAGAGSVTINPNRGITLGAGGGTLAKTSGARLTCQAIIAGPGALTWNGAISGVEYAPGNSGTYSGGTTLTGDPGATVIIGSSTGSPGSLTSGPFGTGPVILNGPALRAGTGAPATNGNAISIAADTTFPSASPERSLTLNGPVTLSGGSRVLTVIIGATNSNALKIAGAVGDGGNGYGLTKAGNGRLILSGANTNTGATTVSAGTLEIDGTNNGTGAVTVAANATLAGYGQINGPVAVQAGGSLSLGAAIGTLTISNTLTLQSDSTNVMKLAKGASPSHDALAGISTLTYGGTLTVLTNAGMPALAAGDSFQLFQASSYTGSFAATNLPALTDGLQWDTSGLANGLLKVVDPTALPPAPPTLSKASKTGTNLVLVWSGGTNASCTLWTATNVAQPRGNWTPVVTNVVGTDGLSTNTLPIIPGEPKRFYLLSVPSN